MAVGVGIIQIVLKFCPEMAGEGPIHSEIQTNMRQFIFRVPNHLGE